MRERTLGTGARAIAGIVPRVDFDTEKKLLRDILVCADGEAYFAQEPQRVRLGGVLVRTYVALDESAFSCIAVYV